MIANKQKADICLCLEGTYPYITGGVSNWAHELIINQKHLSFHLVAILAPNADPVLRYDLPDNVLSLTNITVQQPAAGESKLDGDGGLFEELEEILLRVHTDISLSDFKRLMDLLAHFRGKIGSKVLLDSRLAWELLLRMYEKTFPDGSFLDYFWSWRGVFGGLYSILLSEVPPAQAYHSLCTGYAGLFAARASLETGAPCVLTEHGIYTIERRIEISVADWLHDLCKEDLTVSGRKFELRDFWINTFKNYSRICYEASRDIVTLYEENQKFQIADGADPAKLKIIPNGIDYPRYSAVKRTKQKKQTTIALIGRVVPIKGIKIFVQACNLIKEQFPDLKALILGPTNEDEAYYQECRALVEHLKLEEVIEFTGQVKLEDYLGHIDVMALTSISEAQPLVLLEAGAAGIPAVATNVGACREIIEGRSDEDPALGKGGEVAKLANARDVADCIIRIIGDKKYHAQCSEAMKKRVLRYYNKVDQHAAYKELYESVLGRQAQLKECA